MTSSIGRLRRDEAWRERCEARAREFDEAIERRAAGIPPPLPIEDRPNYHRSDVMRFRRCKVAQIGGTTVSASARHAWVPVDKAIAGSVVRLQFPMWDEADFSVIECDTLVIDGAMLAYVIDEPMGSMHR